MQKQWVLKKDLPRCPAGTKGELNIESGQYCFCGAGDLHQAYYHFNVREMEDLPDFFECREVLWKPITNDIYFTFTTGSYGVYQETWTGDLTDINRFNKNVVFGLKSSVEKLLNDLPEMILRWRRENPECE